MKFPQDGILSVLTGKKLNRIKRDVLRDYNVNLNDICSAIVNKHESLLKCTTVPQVAKTIRPILKKHNIKLFTRSSPSYPKSYRFWVEAEYHTLKEDMSLFLCCSSSVSKNIKMTERDLFVLASCIPIIISHEAMHIAQHYRSGLDDLLYSKTPLFEFGIAEDDQEYLLEDIEMEAFVVQMILEHKVMEFSMTRKRYLSLFSNMKKKIKTPGDLALYNKTLINMNNLIEKYCKKLGHTNPSKLKFRLG